MTRYNGSASYLVPKFDSRWISWARDVGVDIFNFPNTHSVLARNNTYNPANVSTYRQPTQIIPARFFKFSVQFDF